MYKSKYRKYKAKYLNLKNRMNRLSESETIFNNDDIQSIDTHINGLLHCTTIESLKSIMKDGYLKSDSLSSSFKPRPENWTEYYHYLVFTSIWFKSDEYPDSYWGIKEYSKNHVCLIIDPNILFDKNAYYYINPSGEHGYYAEDSIPSPNIKKILASSNPREYIDSLSVNDNTKMGLMYLLDFFEANLNTINNTISMHINEMYDSLHEICFVDQIDMQKYLIGVYTECGYQDKVSKIVPKNLIHTNDTCRHNQK